MSFDYFSKRRMQYILEKLKTIFDTKADISDVPDTFADLTDTAFVNLQNGQVAIYNSTAGKWKNQNLPSSTDLFTITLTSSEDSETGETIYTADKLPSEAIAAYNSGDVIQLVMSSGNLPYYFTLGNAVISEDESESETGFMFQRLFVYDDDDVAFGQFILVKEQNVDAWDYIDFIHNFLAVGGNSLVAEITENNNVYTCDRTFEEVSNAYYGSKDIFIKFGSRIFKISRYESSTNTFYFTSTIANANRIDVKTFVMTGSYITEDWTSITMTDTPITSVEVVDNLTTNDSTKALSAKQGKVLKDAIDAKSSIFTITLTENVDPQTGEVTFTSDKLPSEVISARNNGSIIRLTVIDEAKYYFDLSIDHITEEETGFIFTNVRASSNHQVVFVGFNLIKDANSDTWASIEFLNPEFNETIFIEMEESSGEYSCNVDFNTLDDAYYSSTDMIIEFESEFFRLVKYDTSEDTFYFANTVSDSNGIKTRTFVMVGDESENEWTSITLTESSGGDPNAIKWSEAETSVKKNWLSVALNTKTANGVTYTVNSDKTITVNGTCTANINTYINEFIKLPEGDYIISGVPDGTNANANLWIGLYDGSSYSSAQRLRADTGKYTWAFTVTSSIKYVSVRIDIDKDFVANNLVFRPMIRLASIEDDTYVPYIPDNTELVDWKSYNVLGAKNLLAGRFLTCTVNGTTFTEQNDGTVIISSSGDTQNANLTSEQFTLKKGSYYLGRNISSYIGGTRIAILVNNSVYQNIIGYDEWIPFTITSDIVCTVRLYLPAHTGAISNVKFEPMIRLASDIDSTYVPYAPTNRQLFADITPIKIEAKTYTSSTLSQIVKTILDNIVDSGNYQQRSFMGGFVWSGNDHYTIEGFFGSRYARGSAYTKDTIYWFNYDSNTKQLSAPTSITPGTLSVWTSSVSALTGATSVTITNINIHTTSVIEPFADNGTNTAMPMPTMTVTEGQCVLGFDALASNTSFKLRISN